VFEHIYNNNLPLVWSIAYKQCRSIKLLSLFFLQEARYEKVFKETESESDYLGRLVK